MSKLPPEFVKAPSALPAQQLPAPRARKPRKASIVAADPRELLVRLTDDELRALEEARAALERAGERVTIEQLLHRVIAEWMVRRTPAAQTEPQQPAALRDRLRALAARTWRELGAAALRRMSNLTLR